MTPPVGVAGTTRQARQRARTRAALVTATRELASEKDVSEIKINEITERADVGLGSFYNHFTTKEAVVETVVAELLESSAATILSAADDGRDDPVRTAAVAQYRFIELAWTAPAIARLMVHLDRAHAVFEAALADHVTSVFSTGLAAGAFHDDDPAATVISTIGATLATMRAILDGRLGRQAAAHRSRQLLLALGVAPDHASRVVADVCHDPGPAADPQEE